MTGTDYPLASAKRWLASPTASVAGGKGAVRALIAALEAVQRDVSSSGPILATSPERGKPVAELIAEIDAIWAESQQDATVIRDAGIMQAIVERLRPLAAALDAVQPVTPDRDEAVKMLLRFKYGTDRADHWTHTVAYRDAEMVLDALLASGVLGQPQPLTVAQCAWCADEKRGTARWQGDGERHPSCGAISHGFDFEGQPQPQPDREALGRWLFETFSEHQRDRWDASYMGKVRAIYLEHADALLPLLGQPQPQPDPEDMARAMFDAGQGPQMLSSWLAVDNRVRERFRTYATALLPLLSQPRPTCICDGGKLDPNQAHPFLVNEACPVHGEPRASCPECFGVEGHRFDCSRRGRTGNGISQPQMVADNGINPGDVTHG